MSAISNHLLPDNSVIDAQGVMSIGGCSLVEVAKQFGTPVFVYDEDHMRARCHEAVKAFGLNRVIYATKAFFCTAMAKLAYDEGLMLDVATGGELFGECAQVGSPLDGIEVGRSDFGKFTDEQDES